MYSSLNFLYKMKTFKLTSGHLLLCVLLYLLWGATDSTTQETSTSLSTTATTGTETTNPATNPSTTLATTTTGSTVMTTGSTEMTTTVTTGSTVMTTTSTSSTEMTTTVNVTTNLTTTTAPVNVTTTLATTTAPVTVTTNLTTTTAPVNVTTTLATTTAPVTVTTNLTTTTAPVNVTTTLATTTAPVNVTTTLATTTAPVNVTTTLATTKPVPAPANPEEFRSTGQDETSITLQWRKVDDILEYTLICNGREDNIRASEGDDLVNHTVLGLTSGTKYNFTLFSVSESIRSSGISRNASTVPSQVASVNVTVCSVNNVTLTWQIDETKDWMYFLHINDTLSEVYPERPGNYVFHSVQPLQPGREYPFSLITGFSGLNSTAYNGSAVTAVDCTNVSWHVTNSTIQGMVYGLFTNATITNGSQPVISSGRNNVSFTGLYPGATYEISFEHEHSTCTPQCSVSQTILPADVGNAQCHYWANGYSVRIVWDEPKGVLTEVEVNVTGQTHNTSENHIIIPGFQPAKTYSVSVVSLSGTKRSQTPVALLCKTDPRGVIAGSVLGVLLFVLLIILIILVVLKRPQIMRKRPFSGDSKRFGPKSKPVPLAQFPQHFYQLSADDNRGFSEQYETLMPVGTEQTQTEALLPGNKTKNRFINVLPYDRSRVKLNTPNPNVPCDYINANYMPGHNNNREYIATQGPLPNTVNDFWRMIWEHRVKGVVMLANCIEAGRTKCEQYWPSGNNPSTYGNLEVTLASEQRSTNWTLREFIVKQGNTSEERTVKHFHFTAWPDHGIPQGTEDLIQFRRLMRQHIEREASGAPTVIHCSAGVGRTGTIIALDVLLQQLEEEGTVNVSDFVHKMRLNRPHMVQTESQYVFLHQCIMDYLQIYENSNENIYENEDLMYVNATIFTSTSPTEMTTVTTGSTVMTTGSTEMTTVTTGSTAMTTTTPVNVTTTLVTTKPVPAPANPEEFRSTGQNETSITLQWRKVDDILEYTLIFNGREDNIRASEGDDLVNHTVLGLTSGTKYNFTLFSVSESIRSSGISRNASTVPSQVASVNVTVCSVNNITLTWQIDETKDWMYFLHINDTLSEVYPERPGNYVFHSVQPLQPGREYPFSLITGFSGLNSTAYNGSAVTAVDCTNVSWHVTNSTIQGMVYGLFTNATITNGSQTVIISGRNNVSFTGLYPGATYEISFEYEHSTCTPQCSVSQTILPADVENAQCHYWANGYSVRIVWDEPKGVFTEVEVNVAGQTHNTSENHIIIPGFQPARTYSVSVVSLSGTKRSQTPVALLCKTDPRGVIAGSVLGVLLFVLLVIVIILIVLKRPQFMRKHPFSGDSKRFGPKSKPVPLAQFPQHFYQLSADDNRGFSEQYETLMPVGTEQTQTEALLPGNKTKNRFINVLPYDRSRVRLNTPNPNIPCDYINANYMPGHNNNREYIATQGPLPNTVNDFWRMIWEHRVKDVVMLTNCVEAGRNKCEQYWPAGNNPSTYGDLKVTLSSEQRSTNWTLREFIVKQSNTSEERTVKHFHFTAWPDHGIPQGTEDLIQFRNLMRQHIEREASGAPTVIHCSDGAGRTGTIIALDVLLQQLEEEGTVNVSDFVHKMRLSRPLMVQTESQYVFLHQCIMDYLQFYENPDENIYENDDLVDVNGAVLRIMHSDA
ncbi:uncharacterized protein V6R79_010785 [Siganus canaliculatus]